MKTLERLISPSVATIIFLLIYASDSVVATFIEKYHGTAAAEAMIYYSPLFFLLQFLLVANFMAIVIRHQLLKRRRWGLMVTHAAFIVILLDAFVSYLLSEEGTLHLHEGEASDRIMIRISDQTLYHTLPFSVKLVKFTLARYPGFASPSAYESELLIHVDGQTRHAQVYMNNVLDVKGYRFFQASCDPDEQGTVLSVNRDVTGRNITCTDYVILVIGFILCLVGKNSRFMKLSRQLEDLGEGARRTALLAVVLLSVGGLWAQDAAAPEMKEAIQKYTISPEHAAKFGAPPIQSVSGRILPINTFSSEVLRKLHRSDQFGFLNSDQFLLSVLAVPDTWVRVPFIALSNSELASYYDLTNKECAYVEVFGSHGRYKLQEKLDEAYSKMPAERTHFDKDLIKLDEQVNIFHQLINYQVLNLFPKEDDPDHKWYAPGDDLSASSGKDSMFVIHITGQYLSEVQEGLKSGDWEKADEVIGMIHTYQQAKNKTVGIRPEKIQAEIKCNQMDVFRQCKKGHLILGDLLLIFAFVALFKKEKWITYTTWLLSLGILAIFVFHIYGMGMWQYIAGYAPWSNSYETMVYVAWATVFAGLLFVRKSTLTFVLATLFGGIILFVSGLSWMDPQINPLVPVLKSPWLVFHVAIIVGAYGFFGISCLIDLTDLVMMSVSGEKNSVMLKERVRELGIVNKMSLWIGLALMTIGTLLGAVWVNESWGCYWGQDPRETWTLITMVIYAIVTHLRLIPKCNNLWLSNFTSISAFYLVLMIFFGVNYFLSGMHSYGQNDNMNGIFVYLYLSIVLVLGAGFISYRKRTNFNNIIV